MILQHLRADAEEELFRQAAVFQRAIAEVEQAQHRFLGELRIVVILHEVGFIHVAIGLEKIDHRRRQLHRCSWRKFLRNVEPLKAAPSQHVEDQHAVIRHHRPAGFADDRRMIDAFLVADFLDVEDDVVGVFLEAVVDAGAEVGFGAVVVDAQAAADVDVFEAGAEALHFGVDANQFDDRRS